MGGLERKAADLVASWDRFSERENGFLPPKLAALYLGLTTQGIYAAADRGVLRYTVLGVSRFYSAADVYRERTARDQRILSAAVKPLDRYLQIHSGYDPVLPDLPPMHPSLGHWHLFLADHTGAYPSQVAAAYLRVRPQAVWLAHRAGWIRSFLVGRENFFSRRDVQNYWWQASRKNTGNRPIPRFRGRNVDGKC